MLLDLICLLFFCSDRRKSSWTLEVVVLISHELLSSLRLFSCVVRLSVCDRLDRSCNTVLVGGFQ